MTLYLPGNYVGTSATPRAAVRRPGHRTTTSYKPLGRDRPMIPHAPHSAKGSEWRLPINNTNAAAHAGTRTSKTRMMYPRTIENIGTMKQGYRTMVHDLEYLSAAACLTHEHTHVRRTPSLCQIHQLNLNTCLRHRLARQTPPCRKLPPRSQMRPPLCTMPTTLRGRLPMHLSVFKLPPSPHELTRQQCTQALRC